MKKILTSIIFIIFCSIFQVNAQFCVNFGDPRTICNGQSRIFRAYFSGCTNPQSVFWAKGPTTNGPWTIIGNGSSITVTPNASVAYSCGLTNSTSNSNFGPAAIWFTVDNPLTQPSITASGQTTFCDGSNVSLSLPNLGFSTTYQWKLNNSNIGINSFTHLANLSGNYTAVVSNTCGSVVSNNAILVTVNPLPVEAGAISGTTLVCQGENSLTYTVPPITNATSYIWTLPTGATGTSITNSITVNYGASAVSGNIIVKGINSCGDGVSTSLSITVNIKPNTPIISQTGNILNSNASSGNQWYNQNGLIVNAVSQNYNLVSDGNYYVIVTNSNGCSSNPSNILNAIVLGVNNYELDNLILYPNPIIKILHIEIEKEFTGTIYDITGKTLINVNSKDIDVSSLSPGIYLLDIISENKHYTKKLIKQ